MRASPRNKKIMIQRRGEPTDDGYNSVPGEYANYAPEYAAIYFGSGKEQREAAQESASQTATFEVLSNSKTRSLSVTDRVLYPVSDEDPTTWPAWDIQAVSEIGLNEGVAIVATRAAS